MERRAWRLVCLALLAGLTVGAARAAAETQSRPEQRGAALAAKPTPQARRAASRAEGRRAASRAEPRRAASRAEERGSRAVILGSSSIRGTFGRIMETDLERWGLDVERLGVVSAGLARPDFVDVRRILDEAAIDGDTFAVFVYLGVNDGQSIWLRPHERRKPGQRWLRWRDPRWSEVYQRRARELFQAICERGARHALVLLPVPVAKPSLERKLARIRQLQRQAARGASCAQVISTAGSPEEFSRERKRLRLKDGFHMSRLGARRVWERVQRRARPLLEPLYLADEPGVRPGSAANERRPAGDG